MYLPNPMSRSQVHNKHGVEDVSGYAGQVARKAGDEQISDCATEAPVPLLVLHQQLETQLVCLPRHGLAAVAWKL